MDNPKTQITGQLNKANNILVTVSASPTVDQLAGAVGLTLLLNALGKHATAVFSGDVPSTLEFLQPEKTLEKNTDSLRDFIIALDKSKADKLRYKVEDQMVKIFITPYRTSLSDKDLEFSQGDFNVDVIMALGVNEQRDLDQAIVSHGRILHDATIIGLHTQSGASLGTINWVQADASSLCEMLTELGLALKADVLDSQIATAFMTGIVAETHRFSNEKTSSQTMEMSAKLMAAGANQQLIASQLQPMVADKAPDEAPKGDLPADTSGEDKGAELPDATAQPDNTSQASTTHKPDKSNDGSLAIDHGEPKPAENNQNENEDESSSETEEKNVEEIHIDEEGKIQPISQNSIKQKVIEPLSGQEEANNRDNARLITEPPTLGGKLTANSGPEMLDPSIDPLSSTTPSKSLLSHGPELDNLSKVQPLAAPSFSPLSSPIATPDVQDIIGGMSSTLDDSKDTNVPEPSSLPNPPKPAADAYDVTDIPQEPDSQPTTLSDLEKKVRSPHLDQVSPATDQQQDITNSTDINAARDAVLNAVGNSSPPKLEPVQSLNAAPMDLNLGDMPAVATSPLSAFADQNLMPPTPPAPPMPSPSINPNPHAGLNLSDHGMPADNTAASVDNPTAPPPVPPPLMGPPPDDQQMTHGQQPLPNAEDDNQSVDPMAPL